MRAAVANAVTALAALSPAPGARTEDPWQLGTLVDALGTLILLAPDAPGDPRDARAAVWRALVLAPSEALSAQNFSAARTGRPIVLGELGVLAVLRLTWIRLPALALDERIDAAGGACVSELVPALQALRTDYSTLAYGDSLLDRTEMLECAAARMIFATGTRDIFDVGEPLCTRVGDDEWRAGRELLQIVWPTLLGCQRRLVEARCLLLKNIDEPPVDAPACRRLCTWLVRRSKETTYRDASPSLKAYYIRAHMRPGDRELDRLLHPTVTTSDAGIVAASLGDTRMADINRCLQTSPSAAIRAELDTPEPAQPESLVLGFCLYDFLEMISQDVPGCSWARFYARPELDLDTDEVQRTSLDVPLVVQVFNHWQLAHGGSLFWYNSAVAAIVEWLRLLDAPEPGEFAPPTWLAARRAPLFRALADWVLYAREPREDDAGEAGACEF